MMRRTDGTVLTRDCPVGLRALRRRLALAIAVTAGLVASGRVAVSRLKLEGAFQAGPPVTLEERLAQMEQWARTTEPFRSFLEWLDPTSVVTMGAVVLMPPTRKTGAPPR